VAFVTEDGLFTQYGTTITPIAATLPGLRISPFAVNNAGAVAFVAATGPTSSGAFVGDGATTTKIADNVFYAAINNSGVVVFQTMSGPGLPSSAIFVGPDPITRVVGIGDTVLGTTLTTIGGADLNDNGQISFVGNSNGGAAFVYRATPGPGGYTFAQITALGNTPSINNSGQVSFVGGATPPFELFVGDGITVAAVATTNDGLGSFRFAGFGSTPVINNGGAVSFWARSDSGDQGIFVGQNGIFTKIADNIAMGPCANYGTFTGISDDGRVIFHCTPNSPAIPVTADECKKGGWKTFTFLRTFKNQGDCIQFVNTGK
jgi:hypothetical protein